MNLTPRVERLLLRIPERQQGAFWERRLHWAESMAETRGQPQVLRAAKAFARVLDNMTVAADEDELIVGRHPKGAPPPEIEERIHHAQCVWGGDGLHAWATAQMPDDALALARGGVFTTCSKTGHMTPDHAGLLRRGLGGLREHVAGRLARVDLADPEAGAQRVFLLAAETALAAAARFCLRYAEAVAGEGEGRTRQVASLHHLSTSPPRSFHEALQLSWLLHLWVCIEEGEAAAAFAPGRVDQYLYPFFGADVASGRISEDEAFELLCCYWLKFSEIGYMTIQTAVLGGLTPAGQDGTNRLTELCLEAAGQLRVLEPSLVLRVHEGTPRPVLRRAAELLRNGMGFPQLYNDHVATNALERAGCLKPEARDYCIGGCVELTVQGMSDPWVGNFLNLPKCLALALNEGVCTLSGEKLGASTPPAAEILTFDDVREAYCLQVEHAMARMALCENVWDRGQAHCTPFPFLSANVLDCVERATDISASGARHNFTEVQGVGIANVADSLAAIRQFVFEEGRLPLGELAQKLRDDFAEAQDLRLALLRDAPKYGTGSEEPAALARWVVEHFVQTVEGYGNPRGGRFRAGLLVWTLGDDFGALTGATPDGRKARAVLADSVGPAQGRDREGPTAVISDVTQLDFTPIVGGCALNLKFMPQTLASEEGVERFIDLVRTYFAQGGMQLQVNVVDDATLRRAQEQPELYGDLTVRISGWSARFLMLPKRLQDEIIARTSQGL